MKYSLTILSLALCLPALAMSQQTTNAPSGKAALADQLLVIMQVDKRMDSSFQQVMKMQEQLSTTSGLTPEAKAKHTEMMQAMMNETRSLTSWENIKPTFIRIYADVFTEEELQGMIEFFKTPTGQKWIAKQPQLQAETMQKMQAIMMTAQPKMLEIARKSLESKVQQATNSIPTPNTASKPAY